MAPMKILRIAVRALVALQLLLGLAVWFADAYSLVPFHVLVGLSIVVVLLVAAFLARATAPRGVLALAIGWAILLPIFGLKQQLILPGDLHWIVRVLHLAVGLATIGVVERLARGTDAAGDAAALASAG